jgi:Tfp pilus assembly protein PilF
MQNGKLNEAIAAFEMNCRLFPLSYNTWDSLAEGYLNKGENELAIRYYRKSLELNPDNKKAKEILKNWFVKNL